MPYWLSCCQILHKCLNWKIFMITFILIYSLQLCCMMFCAIGYGISSMLNYIPLGLFLLSSVTSLPPSPGNFSFPLASDISGDKIFLLLRSSLRHIASKVISFLSRIYAFILFWHFRLTVTSSHFQGHVATISHRYYKWFPKSLLSSTKLLIVGQGWDCLIIA